MSPSVRRNPAASSSSCPGVRMVTLIGRVSTWISSGSSAASKSGCCSGFLSAAFQRSTFRFSALKRASLKPQAASCETAVRGHGIFAWGGKFYGARGGNRGTAETPTNRRSAKAHHWHFAASVPPHTVPLPWGEGATLGRLTAQLAARRGVKRTAQQSNFAAGCPDLGRVLT